MFAGANPPIEECPPPYVFYTDTDEQASGGVAICEWDDQHFTVESYRTEVLGAKDAAQPDRDAFFEYNATTEQYEPLSIETDTIRQWWTYAPDPDPGTPPVPLPPGVYVATHHWDDTIETPAGRDDPEITDSCTIIVVRVTITSPNKNWNEGGMRYNDQGVVDGAPGEYDLTVSGTIEPAGFTPFWTHGPGELCCDTILNPAYYSPSSAGGGSFTLTAKRDGVSTGFSDSETYEIYESHLDRDMDNFVELYKSSGFYMFDPRPASGDPISNDSGTGKVGSYSLNCHSSSSHAYNNVAHSNWSSNPANNWTVITQGQVQKGDICRFGGDLDHSTTAVGGGRMWGANNAAAELPPAIPTQRWNECGISAWLTYQRVTKGRTVSETYYQNPENGP